MTTLHKIQITILQRLLYSDGLKYAQIKPPKVVGSKFTFHLSQLSKFGYITKNGILYKLTFLGKELANRMDLGDERVKVQAKISAIMACIKGDQYLLYTRQKSPFYGYQGFPTGKVKYGEDIAMAAKRELKEETGLTGNPTLSIIRHYKIYDKKKNLLEDKIFFVYKFINPKGTLRNNPE